MMLAHMKGLSVLKTVMLKLMLAGVLLGLSAFVSAESPPNKATWVKHPHLSDEQLSASAAATARLQAEAIAEAARGMPMSAQLPVSPPAAVVSPAKAWATVPTAPSAALAARPSVAEGPESLNADELAIAARVHKGHLSCEFGVKVSLEADAAQPGYFHLQGKGFRYRMRPVPTTTGAIRLEDAKAGAVWLQLANKSMLMDQKKGRRVADDCANAEQTAFAEHMKTNPLPKLFDTTGMGR